MEPVTSALLQYGLPGIVILGLCLAVKALYDANEQKNAIIQELNDKRLQDFKSMHETMEKAIGAVEVSAKVTEALRQTIDAKKTTR